MAGRPLSAVPNIFASEGTGTLNNTPLLDQDFATLVAFNNDSAIGYVNYAVDTGVANSYVVTLASPPSAYLIGMTVVFTPANSNTGASVINVNSLGSVSILTPAGTALSGGEISDNQILALIFTGTSFLIIGPCPRTVNTASSSTSLSVNCAGCSSVSVYCNFSGSGLHLSLFNLSSGVPVEAVYVNSSGSSAVISMVATQANGSSFSSILGAQSGSATGTAFVDLTLTGITLSNGFGMSLTGITNQGALILSH